VSTACLLAGRLCFVVQQKSGNLAPLKKGKDWQDSQSTLDWCRVQLDLGVDLIPKERPIAAKSSSLNWLSLPPSAHTDIPIVKRAMPYHTDKAVRPTDPHGRHFDLDTYLPRTAMVASQRTR